MHEFIVLPIPALQSGRVRDARYAYPVQPISLQDPGEPSPLPIGSFTTLFPPFSSRYHRSSRSPSFELGPIPRVTPIHRSHVLIGWSLPQGMRCCTVSQTAVAKKMRVHLHLFPAPRIHALEDVHAEYLHVFLSNTSAHRCAFCLRVCLFLKRRCFA